MKASCFQEEEEEEREREISSHKRTLGSSSFPFHQSFFFSGNVDPEISMRERREERGTERGEREREREREERERRESGRRFHLDKE